jgi:hypothetical protein
MALTMKEYLDILGHEVTDKVTGFTGIATTVGFDLYGCVQVIVSRRGANDKGERFPSEWFDHKRLTVTAAPLVMEQPTFNTVAGGYEKPVRN